MARGAHGWPSLHICRAAGEANIDEVNRAHRGTYHELNISRYSRTRGEYCRDKCEEWNFKAQTKGRRERKRKGKEEEAKERGKERGKGKLEVKLWQKRKKSQTPQPGIEPGTPANAADALPLSHQDKRHHQLVCSKFYPFCLHFTT